MALEAGELRLTLQFAQGLKDEDWFGKQDPYCIIQCGSQKVRSRTHTDGGRNPVWNENFNLQVVNENEITVTIMDADVLSRDDLVGIAHIPLAQARECLNDVHFTAPVITKRGKQRGFLSVVVRFVPNRAMRRDQYAPSYSSAPYAAQHPAPYPVSQPLPTQPYPSYQQPFPPVPPPQMLPPQQYQPQQYQPQPQPIRPYHSESAHYYPPIPQPAPAPQPQYLPQAYSMPAYVHATYSAPPSYTYQQPYPQPYQQPLMYR